MNDIFIEGPFEALAHTFVEGGHVVGCDFCIEECLRCIWRWRMDDKLLALLRFFPSTTEEETKTGMEWKSRMTYKAKIYLIIFSSPRTGCDGNIIIFFSYLCLVRMSVLPVVWRELVLHRGSVSSHTPPLRLLRKASRITILYTGKQKMQD